MGSNLLDLGAGTGWPGLFLAKESGCKVTLVDLPEIGLQIAERRGQEGGLTNRVSIKVADAADYREPADHVGVGSQTHGTGILCETQCVAGFTGELDDFGVVFTVGVGEKTGAGTYCLT